MRLAPVLPVFVCLASLVVPAAAQTPQTRAEALRQQREEKQRALRPNTPDRLQKLMRLVEDRSLLLTTRDGFHPKLGSLAVGSGFAYGVGYRNRDIFARRGVFETFAASSIRKYWAIEARTIFPDLADGHAMAEAVGSLREYPQEDFFGIGPDSLRANRTNYALRTTRVGGRGGVRPVRPITFGAGLEYLTAKSGHGTDPRFPSLEERFNPNTVPGFNDRTPFIRTLGFVDVDYRQPLNARKGGWYRVEFSRYNDRDDTGLSFNSTDVDLRQYISFLAERRVIALRGFMSTTNASDGNSVPFYFMPTLGGNTTLRGFRDYRFRGPHSLLLQAEYRWEIWSGLEGAFFYDAGKVALRRRHLNFRDLESDYGIGFRFNTDNGVILRVDAAFGSRDGNHLHIIFGGVF